MKEFIEQENVNTGLQLREMFRGLWPFARPHQGLLILASATMSVAILTGRLIPQTIGYAVDRGVTPKNASALQTAAWAFLFLEILHASSQFLYQYLFQKFGNRILADLREKLLGHVQSLPLNYFHRNPIGRLVTRLTNDPANLNEVFSEGLVQMAANVFVLLSIIVSMALISWKLTLITLGLMPFFFWASMRVSALIRVIMRDSKKKLSTLNSFSSERLQGMKALQMLNSVSSTEKKFENLSEGYKALVLDSIRANALLQPIMNIATAVVIVAALGGGGYLSLNNGLALGSLVAFLLHAQDFIPPLRDILDKYQQFQNSLTSAERVFPLLKEKSEEDGRSPVKMQLQGHLKIQNLWFRYEESDPWVFEGLNIEIEPGRKVALIGRTGAGKSTLIALLQRFYEAPPNTIFYDGIAIESLPRTQIRQWLGVVQQDPVLFRGTIADNLSLGDPSMSQDKMIDALQEIGAWGLLARTGRNLESQVEEKGANLSLGERQLLCFARILVFNPPILVLDEATASVDSETEALIQKAVEKITANRTSLIIAHRLSTLRHCDLFFEVLNGKADVRPRL